jgi:HSP20 family protein
LVLGLVDRHVVDLSLNYPCRNDQIGAETAVLLARFLRSEGRPSTTIRPRRFLMFYDVFGPSWSPVAELERVIGEFSRGLGRGRLTDGTALNVWANDEAVAVTAEVPGVDPASIELSIVGDTLTVSGKRPATEPDRKAGWVRRERDAYQFSRTIQLPFRVDAEAAEARVKDGVLTIALRRLEADKPRKIAVSAA